ncbi:hypothetical protein ACLOAU_21475 [Niabella sp. CJ426]|uniref:hypothetical protein n=1 Tax=Niabella sp. CJ426 TaxID=3393740 RepID=UPI003D07B3BD
MIEIILSLLLALCPGCNHIGNFHTHNNGQVTTMGDEGGEAGHVPNQPPPPPPPPTSQP